MPALCHHPSKVVDTFFHPQRRQHVLAVLTPSLNQASFLHGLQSLTRPVQERRVIVQLPIACFHSFHCLIA